MVGSEGPSYIPVFMAAITQHLTSLIRQGDKCYDHGDPFTWSATVRWINGDSVELIGVDAPMTKSVWRDVMNELHRLGIKRFLIHRRRGQSQSWRWFNVKKYPTDSATSAGCNSMTNKESPNVRDLERHRTGVSG